MQETEIQLILNKITTAQASTITMNDGELYLAPDNAVYSVNNVAPVNGNVTISIPTVNNATLTIQKNGTTVNTFTANASSNVTANITVPTKTSDLTNDDGFITGITSSDVTTALGYTPYSSSNPNGYTSNVGTVTSVNNVSPVNGNVTLSIPTKISDLTDDTATYPIDQADVLTNQRTGVVKLWTGTLAQYNAITTKDANTLYNITDDTPSAQGVALAMPDYSNGQSISLNVWTWRTVTKNVYLAIGYAGQTDYPSILLKDDKGNLVTTPYGYNIIIACTINYYTTGIFLPKGYSYQWSTIKGGGACNVMEYPLKGVIS